MRKHLDKLRARIRWKPSPLKQPRPEPHLETLPWWTRAAECIRHWALAFDFWVSPGGQVREWIRHNARAVLMLAIPVFLLLPIVTFGLGQFVAWMAALTLVAGKLIVLPLLALTALVAVTISIQLVRAFFGFR